MFVLNNTRLLMLRKIINKSNYLHIASVYIRDLLGRSCYIKYDDKYVNEIKINGFVVLPIKLDKNICDNIINMIDSNLDKSKYLILILEYGMHQNIVNV